MEPQIQYATTSDGVSIAYAVLGEGTPLVFTSGIWARLHMYTKAPGVRLEDALVAAGFRVVIYDGRGMGSSDRSATDFSVEARLLDLEAVIHGAAVERFIMAFAGGGGSTAAPYAIQLPETVSHFIVVNPYSAIRELWETIPAIRVSYGLQAMAEENWELFTLTIANTANEFADSETARRMAEAYRSSMSAATFVAYANASRTVDQAPLFRSLTVPTLVVYNKSTGVERMREMAQRLAPLIPKARFVETDDAARAIAEFVGVAAPAKNASLPAGTATILFADIADSTALTERMGDAAFRAKAGELDAALRTLIRECDGTPVEGRLVGDGLMAVFTSAHEAIACALRCNAASDGIGLKLHLGLHAGDVTREGNNVYGGAVNIAARVAGASAAGEVLVSDVVRTLARTSAGVTFEDKGEHALKGVAEAQRLWAITHRE